MRKAKLLASILIFLIGAGIFLYPTIANSIVLYQQSNVIYDYDSKLSESRQQDIDKAWKDAVEYNDNLAGDPVHDPFIPNSGYVLPDNYLNVLNISGDGVMGYIEIPKINIKLPIYHGTSDNVLEKGVGHIEGTSLPIGGKFRHSVLCGHRGLPSAKLFSDLDELAVGDEFYIHVLDKKLIYKVNDIEIVVPEDINKYIMGEPDKDIVTLMTCTPYGINTHRLLIRGIRTEHTQDDIKSQNKVNYKLSKYFLVIPFSVLILIVLSNHKKKNIEKI